MTMTKEKWQQTNKNSTQVDENRTEVGGARRDTVEEGEERGEKLGRQLRRKRKL